MMRTIMIIAIMSVATVSVSAQKMKYANVPSAVQTGFAK